MKLKTLAIALTIAVCGNAFADTAKPVPPKEAPKQVTKSPEMKADQPPKDGHAARMIEKDRQDKRFAPPPIHRSERFAPPPHGDRYAPPPKEVLSDKERKKLLKKYDKEFFSKVNRLKYLSSVLDKEDNEQRRYNISCGDFRDNLEDLIKIGRKAYPLYDDRRLQREVATLVEDSTHNLRRIDRLCR